MDRGIVARVRDWDSHPFSGGHVGLRELAGAEFTGAVEGGGTWLFMLNGRAIGVFDGDISGFEAGGGTAYEAPHPALPLLFTMQSRGGETRARYYTDDTPLSEVDSTLSEAGFTGYLELSENVLSGDYYVVYYGGRSMSAAFIGNAGRVVTGDEAFALADEEVGIYEVRTVGIEVVDLPEPDTAEATPTPADTGTGQDDAGAEQEANKPGGDPGVAEEDQPEESATEPTQAVSEPTDEPSEPAEAGEVPDTAPTETEPSPQKPVSDARETRTRPEAGRPSGPPAESDPFSEEAEWRETRTIPALDPEESEGDRAEESTAPKSRPPPRGAQSPTTADSAQSDVESRIEALESALNSRGEEIEHLRDRVESVSAARDRLREERDEFERQLDAGKAASDAPIDQGTGGAELDHETAIVQTDLFIRYGSKGGATLEKAHSGDAERSAVRDNLRLEHHTRFEAEGASVGGQPFETFLTGTIGYRFVEWVVETLFYEILDTDNRRSLADLYDAIPQIDRAEFRGEVTATDEGGETRTHTFDVVCRDRMGKPLLVANINDARDPATGEMTTTLVEGATDVAESFGSLAGAFLVTSSFFEPDALEATAEATGGGLLARDRRKSFVKLSRKSGYHLCLVEARGSAFHVAVPEL